MPDDDDQSTDAEVVDGTMPGFALEYLFKALFLRQHGEWTSLTKLPKNV